MALNVLVVPDKFKGTLTAQQAADAIVRGWRRARPEDRLTPLPMSDGGDGFGEVLGRLLEAKPRQVPTVDAAHRPIEATWWWQAPTRTAIVESAGVIGLAMLPPGRFHPFDLDTRGLAAVLRAAAACGARRCLVGVGGSATNDGGFGMARALAWQFLTARRESIARWTDLGELAEVRPPEDQVLFDDLTVAVDVRNPLLGPTGCSRVYGPQKGLVEFERAERALGQLAAVVDRRDGVARADQPGAGAAGGLGFGLMSFAGARLEPGFDVFRRCSALDSRVRGAQLVITGEGAIDAQTLMGKGVGEVARLSAEANVPCLGLAGAILDRDRVEERFRATYALAPDLTDRASALGEAAVWLERAAALAAEDWSRVVH